MKIASHNSSVFSNFYMDGETAFVDGDTLDHNPYVPDDEAAEAWRAGWLAANRMSMMAATAGEGQGGWARR